MKTSRAATIPYRTKDGSDIREFMHPALHGRSFGVARQSLAEATVAPGAKTELHRHTVTEELYHITSGTGRMTLGDRRFDVSAGDTVCITAGTPHCIENTGAAALVLLCMCSPPYDHGDTQLLPVAPDGEAAKS